MPSGPRSFFWQKDLNYNAIYLIDLGPSRVPLSFWVSLFVFFFWEILPFQLNHWTILNFPFMRIKLSVLFLYYVLMRVGSFVMSLFPFWYSNRIFSPSVSVSFFVSLIILVMNYCSFLNIRICLGLCCIEDKTQEKQLDWGSLRGTTSDQCEWRSKGSETKKWGKKYKVSTTLEKNPAGFLGKPSLCGMPSMEATWNHSISEMPASRRKEYFSLLALCRLLSSIGQNLPHGALISRLLQDGWRAGVCAYLGPAEYLLWLLFFEPHVNFM